MNVCPRCQNSEIEVEDNFCKICGLGLKGKAAAVTTALIEHELQLIQIRKCRIEKRVTDPEERQQLLAVLEAHYCSLQSLMQQL